MACAEASPRLLSLHAVNAADEVLDALVRHGLTRRCACVFHWFSGSSEQLQRAIGAGCWFSVGARILTTRRGRSYARAIPEDRLLLETDLPSVPGAAEGWPEIKAALREALVELERIRGRSLAPRLAVASAQLLGMGEGISEPGPPLCG